MRRDGRESHTDPSRSVIALVEGLRFRTHVEGHTATMLTILLIVLVLLVIGAVPAYPYSRKWGYGPSGILGVILVVVLVLMLMTAGATRFRCVRMRRSCQNLS